MRQDSFSLYDIACACLAMLPLIAVSVLIALVIIPPVSADTLITYPIYDGESTRSVNGTYTAIRNSAGDWTGANNERPRLTSGTISNDFTHLYRGIQIYNTSTAFLPAGAIISSAIYSGIYYAGAYDLGTPSVVLTGGKTASNTTAANGDYLRFYQVEYASRKLYSSLDLSGTVYTNFTITNLSAIQQGAPPTFSTFYFRDNFDVDNSSPVWSSEVTSSLIDYMVSNADVGKRPFITIVYTLPDTTPPQSLSTFANTTNCSQTNISFTKPSDADYAGFQVWWNNAAETNQTNATTWYNKSGLTASTTYTLSTKTFDSVGNVNATFTNYTITTSACVTPTPTTPVPTTALPVGCTYTNLTGATLINSTAWSITLGNLSWGTIQNVTEGNVSIWSCIGTPTTAPPTTAPPIPDLPAPDALDNWMGILLGNWLMWVLLFGALLIIVRD